MASLADENRKADHPLCLVKEKYAARSPRSSLEATFIPFSAEKRMSGVDFDKPRNPQGRPDSIKRNIVIEEAAGSLQVD